MEGEEDRSVSLGTELSVSVPPPSPLTGCYLLIVLGEPHTAHHKEIILQRLVKGLLSWDVGDNHVDLEKELATLTQQAPEGEEARYGERLIQFASENLVTEILIHPQMNTLMQCMRNLLSSFTRHRHLIHSGYTFAGNGSWIMQDGTFSVSDFADAFQENEVQRVIRAYENSISIDIHCSTFGGEWTKLPEQHFARLCRIKINPTDILDTGSKAIKDFIAYVEPYLAPASIDQLLVPSDVVGNIRFSHPTLYVFPGGQGDAALFGINGFNMLVDGGFSRKACWWDFARHLDRLDAVLFTRLNNCTISGMGSVLQKKANSNVYPQIGHFFCNLDERRAIASPDGDKDSDPLLVSLIQEGTEMMANLRSINLKPQNCYSDNEPINLYHKVGHGTLDMYVLNPSKDSKYVREFLKKWRSNDPKLFEGASIFGQYSFPIPNLVSICALIVWRPANQDDTITRIMFPGSTPQHKIFEGLEKIKHLEFLQHPTCTGKQMATITSNAEVIQSVKTSRTFKHVKTKNKQEKCIDSEHTQQSVINTDEVDKLKDIIDNKVLNELINSSDEQKLQKILSDPTNENLTESETKKETTLRETKQKKIIKSVETKTISAKTSDSKEFITKTDTKIQKNKIDASQIVRTKPVSKISQITKDKKQTHLESNLSPLTSPKKGQLATKILSKDVLLSRESHQDVKNKQKSISMKSSKDAANRKVAESKYKSLSPKRESMMQTKTSQKKGMTNTKREPISRRPKPIASPIKAIKTLRSPTKTPIITEKNVSQPKSKRNLNNTFEELHKDFKKSDEETSRSIDEVRQQELDDKEEQEIVREIEAVFNRDSETDDKNDFIAHSDIEKLTDHYDKNTGQILDSEYEEEYLIIEKEDIERTTDDSVNQCTYKTTDDIQEMNKQLKDSQESEKQRILTKKDKNKDQSEIRIKISSEKHEDINSSCKITTKKELNGIEIKKDSKTGFTSQKDPSEKILQESINDDKASNTVESGATTAPTLPEDERFALDEIKEDNETLMKHVCEQTKETKLFKTKDTTPPTSLPSAIRSQKKSAREIVKTPDEVADLPLHEVAEYPILNEEMTIQNNENAKLNCGQMSSQRFNAKDCILQRPPEIGFIQEIKSKNIPVLKPESFEENVVVKTVQTALHPEVVTVTPTSLPDSPVVEMKTSEKSYQKEFDHYKFVPYTEKLRETHITTLDSPIAEDNRTLEDANEASEKFPIIKEDIEKEIEEASIIQNAPTKVEISPRALKSPAEIEKIVTDVAEVLRSDKSLDEIISEKTVLSPTKSEQNMTNVEEKNGDKDHLAKIIGFKTSNLESLDNIKMKDVEKEELLKTQCHLLHETQKETEEHFSSPLLPKDTISTKLSSDSRIEDSLEKDHFEMSKKELEAADTSEKETISNEASDEEIRSDSQESRKDIIRKDQDQAVISKDNIFESTPNSDLKTVGSDEKPIEMKMTAHKFEKYGEEIKEKDDAAGGRFKSDAITFEASETDQKESTTEHLEQRLTKENITKKTSDKYENESAEKLNALDIAETGTNLFVEEKNSPTIQESQEDAVQFKGDIKPNAEEKKEDTTVSTKVTVSKPKTSSSKTALDDEKIAIKSFDKTQEIDDITKSKIAKTVISSEKSEIGQEGAVKQELEQIASEQTVSEKACNTQEKESPETLIAACEEETQINAIVNENSISDIQAGQKDAVYFDTSVAVLKPVEFPMKVPESDYKSSISSEKPSNEDKQKETEGIILVDDTISRRTSLDTMQTHSSIQPKDSFDTDRQLTPSPVKLVTDIPKESRQFKPLEQEPDALEEKENLNDFVKGIELEQTAASSKLTFECDKVEVKSEEETQIKNDVTKESDVKKVISIEKSDIGQEKAVKQHLDQIEAEQTVSEKASDTKEKESENKLISAYKAETEISSDAIVDGKTNSDIQGSQKDALHLDEDAGVLKSDELPMNISESGNELTICGAKPSDKDKHMKTKEIILENEAVSSKMSPETLQTHSSSDLNDSHNMKLQVTKSPEKLDIDAHHESKRFEPLKQEPDALKEKGNVILFSNVTEFEKETASSETSSDGKKKEMYSEEETQVKDAFEKGAIGKEVLSFETFKLGHEGDVHQDSDKKEPEKNISKIASGTEGDESATALIAADKAEKDLRSDFIVDEKCTSDIQGGLEDIVHLDAGEAVLRSDELSIKISESDNKVTIFGAKPSDEDKHMETKEIILENEAVSSKMPPETLQTHSSSDLNDSPDTNLQLTESNVNLHTDVHQESKRFEPLKQEKDALKEKVMVFSNFTGFEEETTSSQTILDDEKIENKSKEESQVKDAFAKETMKSGVISFEKSILGKEEAVNQDLDHKAPEKIISESAFVTNVGESATAVIASEKAESNLGSDTIVDEKSPNNIQESQKDAVHIDEGEGVLRPDELPIEISESENELHIAGTKPSDEDKHKKSEAIIMENEVVSSKMSQKTLLTQSSSDPNDSSDTNSQLTKSPVKLDIDTHKKKELLEPLKQEPDDMKEKGMDSSNVTEFEEETASSETTLEAEKLEIKSEKENQERVDITKEGVEKEVISFEISKLGDEQALNQDLDQIAPEKTISESAFDTKVAEPATAMIASRKSVSNLGSDTIVDEKIASDIQESQKGKVHIDEGEGVLRPDELPMEISESQNELTIAGTKPSDEDKHKKSEAISLENEVVFSKMSQETLQTHSSSEPNGSSESSLHLTKSPVKLNIDSHQKSERLEPSKQEPDAMKEKVMVSSNVTEFEEETASSETTLEGDEIEIKSEKETQLKVDVTKEDVEKEVISFAISKLGDEQALNQGLDQMAPEKTISKHAFDTNVRESATAVIASEKAESNLGSDTIVDEKSPSDIQESQKDAVHIDEGEGVLRSDELTMEISQSENELTIAGTKPSDEDKHKKSEAISLENEVVFSKMSQEKLQTHSSSEPNGSPDSRLHLTKSPVKLDIDTHQKSKRLEPSKQEPDAMKESVMVSSNVTEFEEETASSETTLESEEIEIKSEKETQLKVDVTKEDVEKEVISFAISKLGDEQALNQDLDQMAPEKTISKRAFDTNVRESATAVIASEKAESNLGSDTIVDEKSPSDIQESQKDAVHIDEGEGVLRSDELPMEISESENELTIAGTKPSDEDKHKKSEAISLENEVVFSKMSQEKLQTHSSSEPNGSPDSSLHLTKSPVKLDIDTHQKSKRLEPSKQEPDAMIESVMVSSNVTEFEEETAYSETTLESEEIEIKSEKETQLKVDVTKEDVEKEVISFEISKLGDEQALNQDLDQMAPEKIISKRAFDTNVGESATAVIASEKAESKVGSDIIVDEKSRSDIQESQKDAVHIDESEGVLRPDELPMEVSESENELTLSGTKPSDEDKHKKSEAISLDNEVVSSKMSQETLQTQSSSNPIDSSDINSQLTKSPVKLDIDTHQTSERLKPSKQEPDTMKEKVMVSSNVTEFEVETASSETTLEGDEIEIKSEKETQVQVDITKDDVEKEVISIEISKLGDEQALNQLLDQIAPEKIISESTFDTKVGESATAVIASEKAESNLGSDTIVDERSPSDIQQSQKDAVHIGEGVLRPDELPMEISESENELTLSGTKPSDEDKHNKSEAISLDNKVVSSKMSQETLQTQSSSDPNDSSDTNSQLTKSPVKLDIDIHQKSELLEPSKQEPDDMKEKVMVSSNVTEFEEVTASSETTLESEEIEIKSEKENQVKVDISKENVEKEVILFEISKHGDEQALNQDLDQIAPEKIISESAFDKKVGESATAVIASGKSDSNLGSDTIVDEKSPSDIQESQKDAVHIDKGENVLKPDELHMEISESENELTIAGTKPSDEDKHKKSEARSFENEVVFSKMSQETLQTHSSSEPDGSPDTSLHLTKSPVKLDIDTHQKSKRLEPSKQEPDAVKQTVMVSFNVTEFQEETASSETTLGCEEKEIKSEKENQERVDITKEGVEKEVISFEISKLGDEQALNQDLDQMAPEKTISKLAFYTNVRESATAGIASEKAESNLGSDTIVDEKSPSDIQESQKDAVHIDESEGVLRPDELPMEISESENELTIAGTKPSDEDKHKKSKAISLDNEVVFSKMSQEILLTQSSSDPIDSSDINLQLTESPVKLDIDTHQKSERLEPSKQEPDAMKEKVMVSSNVTEFEEETASSETTLEGEEIEIKSEKETQLKADITKEDVDKEVISFEISKLGDEQALNQDLDQMAPEKIISKRAFDTNVGESAMAVIASEKAESKVGSDDIVDEKSRSDTQESQKDAMHIDEGVGVLRLDELPMEISESENELTLSGTKPSDEDKHKKSEAIIMENEVVSSKMSQKTLLTQSSSDPNDSSDTNSQLTKSPVKLDIDTHQKKELLEPLKQEPDDMKEKGMDSSNVTEFEEETASSETTLEAEKLEIKSEKENQERVDITKEGVEKEVISFEISKLGDEQALNQDLDQIAPEKIISESAFDTKVGESATAVIASEKSESNLGLDTIVDEKSPSDIQESQKDAVHIDESEGVLRPDELPMEISESENELTIAGTKPSDEDKHKKSKAISLDNEVVSTKMSQEILLTQSSSDPIDSSDINLQLTKSPVKLDIDTHQKSERLEPSKQEPVAMKEKVMVSSNVTEFEEETASSETTLEGEEIEIKSEKETQLKVDITKEDIEKEVISFEISKLGDEQALNQDLDQMAPEKIISKRAFDTNVGESATAVIASEKAESKVGSDVIVDEKSPSDIQESQKDAVHIDESEGVLRPDELPMEISESENELTIAGTKPSDEDKHKKSKAISLDNEVVSTKMSQEILLTQSSSDPIDSSDINLQLTKSPVKLDIDTHQKSERLEPSKQEPDAMKEKVMVSSNVTEFEEETASSETTLEGEEIEIKSEKETQLKVDITKEDIEKEVISFEISKLGDEQALNQDLDQMAPEKIISKRAFDTNVGESAMAVIASEKAESKVGSDVIVDEKSRSDTQESQKDAMHIDEGVGVLRPDELPMEISESENELTLSGTKPSDEDKHKKSKAISLDNEVVSSKMSQETLQTQSSSDPIDSSDRNSQLTKSPVKLDIDTHQTSERLKPSKQEPDTMKEKVMVSSNVTEFEVETASSETTLEGEEKEIKSEKETQVQVDITKDDVEKEVISFEISKLGDEQALNQDLDQMAPEKIISKRAFDTNVGESATAVIASEKAESKVGSDVIVDEKSRSDTQESQKDAMHIDEGEGVLRPDELPMEISESENELTLSGTKPSDEDKHKKSKAISLENEVVSSKMSQEILLTQSSSDPIDSSDINSQLTKSPVKLDIDTHQKSERLEPSKQEPDAMKEKVMVSSNVTEFEVETASSETTLEGEEIEIKSEKETQLKVDITKEDVEKEVISFEISKLGDEQALNQDLDQMAPEKINSKRAFDTNVGESATAVIASEKAESKVGSDVIVDEKSRSDIQESQKDAVHIDESEGVFRPDELPIEISESENELTLSGTKPSDEDKHKKSEAISLDNEVVSTKMSQETLQTQSSSDPIDSSDINSQLTKSPVKLDIDSHQKSERLEPSKQEPDAMKEKVMVSSNVTEIEEETASSETILEGEKIEIKSEKENQVKVDITKEGVEKEVISFEISKLGDEQALNQDLDQIAPEKIISESAFDTKVGESATAVIASEKSESNLGLDTIVDEKSPSDIQDSQKDAVYIDKGESLLKHDELPMEISESENELTIAGTKPSDEDKHMKSEALSLEDEVVFSKMSQETLHTHSSSEPNGSPDSSLHLTKSPVKLDIDTLQKSERLEPSKQEPDALRGKEKVIVLSNVTEFEEETASSEKALKGEKIKMMSEEETQDKDDVEKEAYEKKVILLEKSKLNQEGAVNQSLDHIAPEKIVFENECDTKGEESTTALMAAEKAETELNADDVVENKNISDIHESQKDALHLDTGESALKPDNLPCMLPVSDNEFTISGAKPSHEDRHIETKEIILQIEAFSSKLSPETLQTHSSSDPNNSPDTNLQLTPEKLDTKAHQESKRFEPLKQEPDALKGKEKVMVLSNVTEFEEKNNSFEKALEGEIIKMMSEEETEDKDDVEKRAHEKKLISLEKSKLNQDGSVNQSLDHIAPENIVLENACDTKREESTTALIAAEKAETESSADDVVENKNISDIHESHKDAVRLDTGEAVLRLDELPSMLSVSDNELTISGTKPSHEDKRIETKEIIIKNEAVSCEMPTETLQTHSSSDLNDLPDTNLQLRFEEDVVLMSQEKLTMEHSEGESIPKVSCEKSGEEVNKLDEETLENESSSSKMSPDREKTQLLHDQNKPLDTDLHMTLLPVTMITETRQKSKQFETYEQEKGVLKDKGNAIVFKAVPDLEVRSAFIKTVPEVETEKTKSEDERQVKDYVSEFGLGKEVISIKNSTIKQEGSLKHALEQNAQEKKYSHKISDENAKALVEKDDLGIAKKESQAVNIVTAGTRLYASVDEKMTSDSPEDKLSSEMVKESLYKISHDEASTAKMTSEINDIHVFIDHKHTNQDTFSGTYSNNDVSVLAASQLNEPNAMVVQQGINTVEITDYDSHECRPVTPPTVPVSPLPSTQDTNDEKISTVTELIKEADGSDMNKESVTKVVHIGDDMVTQKISTSTEKLSKAESFVDMETIQKSLGKIHTETDTVTKVIKDGENVVTQTVTTVTTKEVISESEGTPQNVKTTIETTTITKGSDGTTDTIRDTQTIYSDCLIDEYTDINVSYLNETKSALKMSSNSNYYSDELKPTAITSSRKSLIDDQNLEDTTIDTNVSKSVLKEDGIDIIVTETTITKKEVIDSNEGKKTKTTIEKNIAKEYPGGKTSEERFYDVTFDTLPALTNPIKAKADQPNLEGQFRELYQIKQSEDLSKDQIHLLEKDIKEPLLKQEIISFKSEIDGDDDTSNFGLKLDGLDSKVYSRIGSPIETTESVREDVIVGECVVIRSITTVIKNEHFEHQNTRAKMTKTTKVITTEDEYPDGTIKTNVSEEVTFGSAGCNDPSLELVTVESKENPDILTNRSEQIINKNGIDIKRVTITKTKEDLLDTPEAMSMRRVRQSVETTIIDEYPDGSVETLKDVKITVSESKDTSSDDLKSFLQNFVPTGRTKSFHDTKNNIITENDKTYDQKISTVVTKEELKCLQNKNTAIKTITETIIDTNKEGVIETTKDVQTVITYLPPGSDADEWLTNEKDHIKTVQSDDKPTDISIAQNNENCLEPKLTHQPPNGEITTDVKTYTNVIKEGDSETEQIITVVTTKEIIGSDKMKVTVETTTVNKGSDGFTRTTKSTKTTITEIKEEYEEILDSDISKATEHNVSTEKSDDNLVPITMSEKKLLQAPKQETSTWETGSGDLYYSDDDEPGSLSSVKSQIGHSPKSNLSFEMSDPEITKSTESLRPDISLLTPILGSSTISENLNLQREYSQKPPKLEDRHSKTSLLESQMSETVKQKNKNDDTTDFSSGSDARLSASPTPETESRQEHSVNKNEPLEHDPIKSWGKPLGLPSPTGFPTPPDGKGTPKKSAVVLNKNKINLEKTRDSKSKNESPIKNRKVTPIYMDLTYVPHHGNSYYAAIDFFKRVRARYYVFSGTEPSKEIYNALLDAKKTWEDKDLEVTIIPTYDTDVLGYWVTENEEALIKYKIDLSPSASRCTINLQDHETSCAAYRLEF